MSTRDQAITGGAQLDELLQTLAPKMQKNINRAALRAGAAYLLPEVKSRIPVDKGPLRDSARITTRGNPTSVSASVKVGNKVAWYSHLVEYGTRPHKIKVSDIDRPVSLRNGKRASVKTINRSLRLGGRLVGPSVDHPGMQGHPFMRPAIDAAFTGVINAVTARIRQRLTKQGLNAPAPMPTDPAE